MTNREIELNAIIKQKEHFATSLWLLLNREEELLAAYKQELEELKNKEQ